MLRLECIRTKLTITISAIINNMSTADSITQYVHVNTLLQLSRLVSKRLETSGGIEHIQLLKNK